MTVSTARSNRRNVEDFDYEAGRLKGNHFTRVPNKLWDRVQDERTQSIDLAGIGGTSIAIMKLIEEALDARKRKRRGSGSKRAA